MKALERGNGGPPAAITDIITIATSFVPFGKYKGQPVESLVADSGYCDWLAAQPWFRDRYTGIYQIILNGPQPPTETPEHNEIQARFLKDDVCLSLARQVSKDVDWDVQSRTVDELLKEHRPRYYSSDQSEHDQLAGQVAEHPDCFEPAIETARVDRRSFEHHGWDVAFTVATPSYQIKLVSLPGCTCPQDGGRLYHGAGCSLRWSSVFERAGRSWFMAGDQLRYLVECKPDLGDDFPAVLRQVKGYDSDHYDKRVVVVRRFASESVEWNDVVAMFAADGITLVSLAASLERSS